MKTKTLIAVLFTSVVLVSCASAVTVVPPTETAKPTSTLTLTPAPTITETITPTLTPEPTSSIGGGILKVAFYAHDGKDQFLLVGDYFSGKVDYKIPVQFIAADDRVSWSPDGSFLLFEDTAKLPTGDMKINLLNLKTGKVFNLSSHPANDNRRWNNLKLLKWSPDGQNVIYSPEIDKDTLAKVYVANIDGTVQVVAGVYSDWLPDSKTIVAFYDNATFNIVEKAKNKMLIYSLNRLKVNRLLRDYIVLDVASSDRIDGILYPKDLNNSTGWQYDTLLANKVTLLTFSTEIKTPRIGRIISSWELPNNKLGIIGFGGFYVGKNTYNMFRIIVDKENLPAVVTKDDLYMDEYPLIFSPDGQFVLFANRVPDENRKPIPGFDVLPRFFRFKLKSISGQEISMSDNLSQFKIADTYIGSGGFSGSPYAGNTFFDGIDFYWQP
jgi:hypothetical protein